MSDIRITQQDIDEILRLVQSADHVAEFRIKYGDLEVSLSRNPTIAGPQAPAQAAPISSTRTEQREVGSQPAAAAKKAPPPDAVPPGMAAVKAPMVGTFYRAASPGAKPFVEVGTAVEAGTVVGIIEVMKLMNSLPAGVAGVVRKILVEDSQPVGFGQVLVVIEPHA